MKILQIIHLQNVHTLTLYGLNITDYSVRHLHRVRLLCLSGCPHITDASVKHLVNFKTLIIDRCSYITDISLMNLVHLRELSIEKCH